jgi:hypothetical protein
MSVAENRRAVSREEVEMLLKSFRPKTQSERFDLTGFTISGLVLNGMKFVNVRFSDRSPGAYAQLQNIEMRKCTFENCSFAGAEIHAVAFRESKFKNCDFRYASFRNTTFMEATIGGCDFYRTTFEGNNVFERSAIEHSSFHLAAISGTDLRRENLRTAIVQEDVDKFMAFLEHFKTVPQERMAHIAAMGPREAVDTYRAFSGLWTGRGYLGDATWAYVRARRLEVQCDLPPLSWNAPVHDAVLRNAAAPARRDRYLAVLMGLKRALPAFLMDAICGFGSSLARVVGTALFMLLFFAIIDDAFHLLTRVDNPMMIPSLTDCLNFSLHSMIAASSDVVHIKPSYEFIPTLETAIGLGLVGLFGFVLGNSVRNS